MLYLQVWAECALLEKPRLQSRLGRLPSRGGHSSYRPRHPQVGILDRMYQVHMAACWGCCGCLLLRASPAKPLPASAHNTLPPHTPKALQPGPYLACMPGPYLCPFTSRGTLSSRPIRLKLLSLKRLQKSEPRHLSTAGVTQMLRVRSTSVPAQRAGHPSCASTPFWIGVMWTCGASYGTASCPTAACMTPGTPALGVFTTHCQTGVLGWLGGCSVQVKSNLDIELLCGSVVSHCDVYSWPHCSHTGNSSGCQVTDKPCA